MNFVRYSWSDVDRLAGILIGLVVASDKSYDGLVAIPRGGFTPAVILSHHLGIPMETQMTYQNHRYLVVDDIVDSGRTLTSLKQESEEFTFDVAALIRKTGSDNQPTYYATGCPADNWVVFPWENPGQAEQEYRMYMEGLTGA